MGVQVPPSVSGLAGYWTVNASGHLVAVTDGVSDGGASGATRPRDLFVSRNVAAAGLLSVGVASGTAQGTVQSGADDRVSLAVRNNSGTSTANTLEVQDQAGTAFFAIGAPYQGALQQAMLVPDGMPVAPLVTNKTLNVGYYPSGTGRQAGFTLFNNPTVGSAQYGQVQILSTAVLSFLTGANGGSAGDIVFSPNGSEVARFLAAGTITLNPSSGGLRINGQSTAAVNNLVGTLTNAPVTGNPAFWLPISIAGTTRYVPCW